jgi:hypothetical protein
VCVCLGGGGGGEGVVRITAALSSCHCSYDQLMLLMEGAIQQGVTRIRLHVLSGEWHRRHIPTRNALVSTLQLQLWALRLDPGGPIPVRFAGRRWARRERQHSGAVG